MANTQEQITVEAVTQYGVRANGRNYGLSPRLKESGIEPNNFTVGTSYQVEIYTGPKGGKSINSYAPVEGAVSVRAALPPPPPSLPRTSVHTTPAPGGVAPVAPASKRDESDKMSKEDWNVRNRSIELQAILKSTLESPMLAQLVVGKNNHDALFTLTEIFEHSLNLYESHCHSR
jgi:hypothetical protein